MNVLRHYMSCTFVIKTKVPRTMPSKSSVFVLVSKSNIKRPGLAECWKFKMKRYSKGLCLSYADLQTAYELGPESTILSSCPYQYFALQPLYISVNIGDLEMAHLFQIWLNISPAGEPHRSTNLSENVNVCKSIP